jgi:hypothetical protein
MGTCNGVLSSCSLAGYALETRSVSAYYDIIIHLLDALYRCHLGKTIMYDTVSNKSWSVNVRKHGIVTVIDEVLGQPWPPSEEVGREVPEAVPQNDCVVRQQPASRNYTEERLTLPNRIATGGNSMIFPLNKRSCGTILDSMICRTGNLQGLDSTLLRFRIIFGYLRRYDQRESPLLHLRRNAKRKLCYS